MHYSTHLFFERSEVEEKLHYLLGNFAMVKDVASLKMGKMTACSTQKNANYNLPLETETAIEHGFVESFCDFFQTLCQHGRGSQQAE